MPAGRWSVVCRGPQGDRALLRVRLGDNGVELHPGTTGPLVLGLLDVGRLRIALREAAVQHSELRSLEACQPDAAQR